MGGMWPTEQTMKSYADVKTTVPKAIADANALFARAATLSASLARHNLTLTPPQPVPLKPTVSSSESKNKR
jgi:hypothetical protein